MGRSQRCTSGRRWLSPPGERRAKEAMGMTGFGNLFGVFPVLDLCNIDISGFWIGATRPPLISLFAFLRVLDCLQNFALGLSSGLLCQLSFPSTPVPVIDEAEVLDALGCGVGCVTCEEQVIARLNSPCYSERDVSQ